jgi:DNA repair exonuclease SbcCD ATPase subunit
MGWLSGYVGADGCVDKYGVCKISSFKEADIRIVMDVCSILGIPYFKFRSYTGSNNFKKEFTCYELNLDSNYLKSNFFIIEQHKKRFLNRKSKRIYRWRVVSIEESNLYEEVYCANVPNKHSFTLEGGILTGNSVVFGQSMVKYFSGLTDSEQKKVVDRLLGITWIPEAWEVAKEDLGVFEKEKNRLEILVGTKETQIKMKLLEIEEEQNRFTGFESVRADTILSIKSELESLKLTDITTLNEKVALLDTEISNLKLQFNEDDFNKLQDKILAMNKEKGIYEGRINYKDTDIKKLNLSLLNLHKKVGTVCSACGQEIKEEFVGFHKIHLLEEINKLEKEFAEINKEFKAIGVEYSDLLSNKQVLLKIKNDISDLAFVKDDCERILYKTNVENARISSQKGGLEKKLEEVVSSDNPYNVDKIEGDLQNILQEQKEFNDSLDKLNDEIKYHTFWVAGFSNAGIKSLIIESMMPQMNQWASAYSGLFDSKFDIKFFAQTKLKKGDFAEKFDVAAFNKVGAQMYDGNSGGEKRVIDLIVMFVLGDLASSRSSKRFSILVMDEIFERLDEEICDKVICVLRSMIGGNGILGTDCMPQRESIFVLTHLDYFKSRFENRIRTWKDRDETKIYDGG